jgi:transposase-like protein
VQPNPQEPAQAQTGPEEEGQPKPRCPNCGWKNVRISHTKSFLDKILSSSLSIQRFKCRSCGRYFRHRYRIPE